MTIVLRRVVDTIKVVHAPHDPKTQARSIYVQDIATVAESIPSATRAIGSVAVSLEDHVPTGRSYATGSSKYFFEREYLEDLPTFSAYMKARLYVVSDVARIFQPNLIR